MHTCLLRTTLVRECRLGRSDVVEQLLQEKADVNAAAGDGGRTTLQAAAGGGQVFSCSPSNLLISTTPFQM
jgi:hypothetical protein